MENYRVNYIHYSFSILALKETNTTLPLLVEAMGVTNAKNPVTTMKTG
ncbi:hypothetical protein [Aliivibrio sp. 1S175]|nr:hypothetical protein [Aliivibrio sp. 1S175]